jgi:hypothetical protein
LISDNKFNDASKLIGSITDDIIPELSNFQKLIFILFKGEYQQSKGQIREALAKYQTVISVRMGEIKPYSITDHEIYNSVIARALFRAGIIYIDSDLSRKIGEYNPDIGEIYIISSAEMGYKLADTYINTYKAAEKRIFEERRAKVRSQNASRSGGAYTYRPSYNYVMKCRDRRLFGPDSRIKIPLGMCTGFESECEQKFRNNIETTGSVVTFCRKQLGSEYITDGIARQ